MLSFITVHLSGKTATLNGKIGAYPVVVVVNSMKDKPGFVVDFGANLKSKLTKPLVIEKVVGKKAKEAVAVVVKVIASRNLSPLPGNKEAAPL